MRTSASAALVLMALGAGCKPAAQDPECVSVGMGWRACMNDMQGSAPQSTPMSTPMPETPAPAKPSDLAAKGGSGGAAIATGRASTGGAGGEGGAGASSTSGRMGAGVATAAVGGESAGSGGAGASGSGGEASGSAGSAAAAGSVSAAGSSGSAGQAGMSGQPASAGAAGEKPAAAGAGGLPTTCCHSLGVCVESSSLRDEQRRLLVPDSCSAQTDVCAPTAVLSTQGFIPKTCRSVLQGEGRCLPDCVAGLAGQADKLPRDTCDTHELCAPCFDPITGTATGSCRLGADPGPRELPHLFRGCCLESTGSTAGLCVPRAYVPAGAAAPRADCGQELFCVPRQRIVDPNAKPTECSAEVRGRGICLSQCIADALALIVTVQSTCPAGNACFPCELVSGDSTGVCPAL